MHTKHTHQYDAIVVGSGISGGWAAKELTEHGLKTLVIERGRNVTHVTDYPTTNMHPWEFKFGGQLTEQERLDNPIASRCYAFREDSKHFFIDERQHPYVQERPFDWIRAYQTGGKSLLWARHTQRWSDYDFEGPLRDGFATDWPIRYADIAPWYSHVERFVGISGNRDGISTLPDGEFLPPMELTCVEKHFKNHLTNAYNDRHLIAGRCAHLTDTLPIHLAQGRVKCQHRDLCHRGCPFGGYFSSNSSTLPWAAKTGNLTLLTDTVVHSVIYDETGQRARGVRTVNVHDLSSSEYYGRLIFINASTLNTNQLLLNSTSARFPDGLANDSGLLGKYIAFHNYRGKMTAAYDGLSEFRTSGRRPASAYIPRFRNVHKQETDFLRGYAIGFNSRREPVAPHDVGPGLVNELDHPRLGPWQVNAGMMGETIPRESNRVWLSENKKDHWGIPVLHVQVDYAPNDESMLQDFREQMQEMLENAGFTDIQYRDTLQSPGLDIHEMGGVRMGLDPKTSLLNKWNQLHTCPNVFVTDGACMTSTSTQNPSLTYMALTARACHYAIHQLKQGVY